MEFTYSVVIPTHNEIRDLEVTVAMVWASEPRPHEIIVVDDCSDEPVADRLLSFPDVKVVRTPEQIGAGPAKRFGAEKATGDVIVLMDSHMRMPLNWLQQADDAIERHPNAVFCCACRNFSGSWLGCGGKFTRTTSQGRDEIFLGRGWLDRGDVNTVDRCPCLFGGCYFIPRFIWVALGGINPYLKGWGYGEQDISIRSWLSGFEVRRINGLCMPHRFQSEIMDSDGKKKRKEGVSNLAQWHNQFNGMVVSATCFEDGVFDRLYRPFYKQIVPLKAVMNFEDNLDSINEFRTFVQQSRVYSDDELQALCNFKLPTIAKQQSLVDKILTTKHKKSIKRRRTTRRKKCKCGDNTLEVAQKWQ